MGIKLRGREHAIPVIETGTVCKLDSEHLENYKKHQFLPEFFIAFHVLC